MAHGGGRCCFGVHEVVFCVVCCMLMALVLVLVVPMMRMLMRTDDKNAKPTGRVRESVAFE